MKIVFTGGGTAGHAMVNTILIPYLQRKGCKTVYIGSECGMEKNMAEELAGVRYYGICTGKLRRYLDRQNLKRIGNHVSEICQIASKVQDKTKT